MKTRPLILYGRQKFRVFGVWHSHMRKSESHVTFRRVIVHANSRFDTLFPSFNYYVLLTIYNNYGTSYVRHPRAALLIRPHAMFWLKGLHGQNNCDIVL